MLQNAKLDVIRHCLVLQNVFWYKPLQQSGGKKNSLDDGYLEGVFVAIQDRTDEVVVLTKENTSGTLYSEI